MAEISIDFEKYDKCVKDIPQVSDKWSYTDVNLLVDGIQNHGSDLSVLADCILTKTPEMVSRFLEMNYYTLNVNFLESIYEKRMNSDNDQKEDGEKKTVEAALNDLYNTQVELVTSKRSVRTEKRQPSTCTYSHDNPNRSFSPTSAHNFSPRIKIAKY